MLAEMMKMLGDAHGERTPVFQDALLFQPFHGKASVLLKRMAPPISVALGLK